MEFKGTQEKWGVSEFKNDIITTYNTNVCQVFKCDMTEGKANTKLIAAAPELLEALTNLVNANLHNNGESVYRQAAEGIKAINKALGL